MARPKEVESKKLVKRHELLKKTLEEFGISQATLSRRTHLFEARGKGKGVNVDQLCRYLKGQRDIFGEALLTIEAALPDNAALYYQGLVRVAEARLREEMRDDLSQLSA